MHPLILDFPNNQFYRGEIVNSATILGKVNNSKFPLKPYLIFELDSTQNLTQNPHVYNTEETFFIYQMMEAIIDILKKHSYPTSRLSIGIVTPYVRQKQELEKQIR